MSDEVSIGLEIEHIGIAVADISRSVGEFQALGYEIDSDVIHDPVQTAYVQFLALPGDHARLELVSPDGPESKLSNAVARGGGLNHLCYWTDDIEAECRRLRSARLLLLQAPVEAVAYRPYRIAWLMGRNGIPIELVERHTLAARPPSLSSSA